MGCRYLYNNLCKPSFPTNAKKLQQEPLVNEPLSNTVAERSHDGVLANTNELSFSQTDYALSRCIWDFTLDCDTDLSTKFTSEITDILEDLSNPKCRSCRIMKLLYKG
jgi:hypothetical protein